MILARGASRVRTKPLSFNVRHSRKRVNLSWRVLATFMLLRSGSPVIDRSSEQLLPFLFIFQPLLFFFCKSERKNSSTFRNEQTAITCHDVYTRLPFCPSFAMDTTPSVRRRFYFRAPSRQSVSATGCVLLARVSLLWLYAELSSTQGIVIANYSLRTFFVLLSSLITKEP